MFNNITIDYNDKKDIYTFNGYYGKNFKYYMGKKVFGVKKLKYFFISISEIKFEIYGFFITDIYYIFKHLIENEGSIYKFDMLSIAKTITTIEEQIFSKSIACKHHFNYDRMKSEIRYEPLKHQLVALDKYENTRCKLNYRGLLLDAAVGSGKTYLSCALSELLNSDKIIVIAPLPTIEKVWVKSVAGGQNDVEMVYQNKQAYFNPSVNQQYNGEKFIIVHYESIKKLDTLLKDLSKNNISVIVDEVHNFNDSKSKRTKELINFINDLNPENVILLSGTPIKAIASEMSTMFSLIDKRFTSIVSKRFEKVYRTPNYLMKQILPTKYSDYSVKIKKESLSLKPVQTIYLKVKLKNEKDYYLDTIRKNMKEYILARHKEVMSKMSMYQDKYAELYTRVKEILLNNNSEVYLKDFTDYEADIKSIIKNYKNNTLMSISPVIARANAFEKKWIEPELAGQDKKDFREAKTIVKYLYLKLQGEALANVVMKARINCYKDIAATAIDYRGIVESSIKKTIVFSNYIDVCSSAEKALKRTGYKSIGVYGSTSKYLSSQVGMFASDKKINPLVATYKSLSTGVPLIMANVILILGLPPRTYIYEQAIGRAWRTGQDKEVLVYIAELNTDKEYNITNRDIDIIKYFKKQVEEITGYSAGVDLEGNELEHNISSEDYYGGNITSRVVTNHRVKTILNEW